MESEIQGTGITIKYETKARCEKVNQGIARGGKRRKCSK